MHLRLLGHALTKIPAEILQRAQVYFTPTKERRELPFHARNRQETRYVVWVELDQHVYVTVGAEIRSQRRTEYRQAPDMPRPAERSNLLRGYGDLGLDGTISNVFGLSATKSL